MFNFLSRLFNRNNVQNVSVLHMTPTGLQLLSAEHIQGLVNASEQTISDHKQEIENIKDRIDSRRLDQCLLNTLLQHYLNTNK